MHDPRIDHLHELADTTGEHTHEDVDLLDDVLNTFGVSPTDMLHSLDDDERDTVLGLLDHFDPVLRIDSPEDDGEATYEGW